MDKKKLKIWIGLIVLVAIAGGSIIWAFPKFILKEERVAINTRALEESNKEIPIESGEVKVAETSGKELYIDTENLDIRVVDKKTKKQWSSHIDTPQSGKDQSLINITYLSKSDKKFEWNAYDNCVKLGNFTLTQLESGVRVNLNLAATIGSVKEILPVKLTDERMEETFVKGLEQALESGKITEKQKKSYNTILQHIYVKDKVKGGYINKAGELSPSGIKQAQELVRVVGYTTDDLRADNEAVGSEIELPQVANFGVIVEITLEDDDLVVRIPTYEIYNGNEFFKLQNIEVLPNFANASSQDVENGYILVPDGAGALFELNTYDASYPPYSRPVYQNTYFDKLYTRDEFPETISMPVFGMIYGKDTAATHGFLGIIEEGSETANISVQLGTKNLDQGGSLYNKVYTSFDLAQYSRVKINGPYSKDDTRHLTVLEAMPIDYTIRYKLFPEEVTYFDMAKTYQEYLVDKYNLELEYAKEPKLYLDVIGAVTLKDRILGVPYDNVVSMTTYSELSQILDELSDMNLAINYKGAFNNGQANSLMNKVNLVNANGSKKELDNLKSKIEQGNDELFLEANLMTIYDDTYPFKAKEHSIHGYDGKPLVIYEYDLASGRFERNSQMHYLLNPKYLSNITDKFLEQSPEYSNIYIGDMATNYYGNYSPKDVVSPLETTEIINKNLEKMQSQKKLALNNPHMDKVQYGKYAINISRESSNYGTMYTSIPFRQLVMNGLIEYTTLDANMSKEDLDYYLLQAVELGSYPKFTTSYKTEDILEDSYYTNYFATNYETLKPRMISLYEEYEQAFSQIDSTEIINHTLLQANVFETEYVNGTKVVTNYNNYSVKVKGQEIESMGYRIINK